MQVFMFYHNYNCFAVSFNIESYMNLKWFIEAPIDFANACEQEALDGSCTWISYLHKTGPKCIHFQAKH
jgi:hypothetical protein